MRLFRRSSKIPSTVPPEVAEYYQSERRGHRGLAWVTTIVTLLVTVAIVIGLFLAGRWLYHTLHHTAATTSTTTSSNTNDSSKKKTTQTNSSDTNTSSDKQHSSDTPPSDSQGTSGNSARPQESTPSADDTTTTKNSSNNSTQSPEPLANTGPGDSAVLTFVVITLVGYIGYRLKFALSGSDV